MYKHKLALALMVISVLLTWFGVGSVHAVRSSDAPPASSLQDNTNIDGKKALCSQIVGFKSIIIF